MTYTSEIVKKIKKLIQGKDYLTYMKFVAEYNGGELISKEYISYDYPYEFNFIKGDDSTRFTRRLIGFIPDRTKGFKYIWPRSLENIIRKKNQKTINLLLLKIK